MKDIIGFQDYIIKIWMDFWISFPVILTIALLAHEGIPIGLFVAMLASSYILGFFIRYLTREYRRYTAIAICTLSSIVTAFALGNTTENSMILFAIYNLIASFRGIFVGERDQVNRKESAAYYLAAMLVYLIVFLIYKFTPSLVEYRRLITYMGLVATMSTLLIVNRDVLIRASGSNVGNYRFLTMVKRNNRIITIVIFLLILAIASYGLLKTGIIQGISSILAGILWLIKSFMSLGKTAVDPDESLVDVLPTPPEQQSHPIWDFIFMILLTIALLAFIVLFAYIIIKLIIKYIPRLLKKLQGFLSGGRHCIDSSGYSDEKESLFDWQSMLKNSFENFKGLFKSNKSHMPKWKDMKSNRQRIRYIYRVIIQGAIDNGLDIRIDKTPKETSEYLASKDVIDKKVADRLIELYGKARYSDNEIQDSETDLLTQQSGMQR